MLRRISFDTAEKEPSQVFTELYTYTTEISDTTWIPIEKGRRGYLEKREKGKKENYLDSVFTARHPERSRHSARRVAGEARRAAVDG